MGPRPRPFLAAPAQWELPHGVTKATHTPMCRATNTGRRASWPEPYKAPGLPRPPSQGATPSDVLLEGEGEGHSKRPPETPPTAPHCAFRPGPLQAT